MTRIATAPTQSLLQASMLRQQGAISETVEQIGSQKKVDSYADLGADTRRIISARAMLDQYKVQDGLNSRVTASLSFYQSRLDEIDTAVGGLRKTILDAVATGNAPNLQGEAEATFSQFRAAMNAADDGEPIFAGAQIDELPLKPGKLADTIGLDPAAAFANDQVRLSARIAPGLDLGFGIVASDFGENFIRAFRTIAEIGPMETRPTQAQLDQLTRAIGEIDKGLDDLRAMDARNGRNQNRVDDIRARSADRTMVLTAAIGDVEDADPAELSLRLASQRTLLDLSYRSYAKLNELSLANYLR